MRHKEIRAKLTFPSSTLFSLVFPSLIFCAYLPTNKETCREIPIDKMGLNQGAGRLKEISQTFQAIWEDLR